MKKIDVLALCLLILGGINWGLWSLWDFNLVEYVFGKVWIYRFIYFLLGVAGIYVLLSWRFMFKKKALLFKIALILLVLSALNWGLVGLFKFNLIDYAFKSAWIGKLIYFIFGVSSFYVALLWQTFKSKTVARK